MNQSLNLQLRATPVTMNEILLATVKGKFFGVIRSGEFIPTKFPAEFGMDSSGIRFTFIMALLEGRIVFDLEFIQTRLEKAKRDYIRFGPYSVAGISAMQEVEAIQSFLKGI